MSRAWNAGQPTWATATRWWITGARPSSRTNTNTRPACAKTSRPPKWTACPPTTTSITRSWVCSSWKNYGLDFSTDDLGAAWVKYLPFAFTAEGIALDNLRKGVPALQAADVDNPCVQYIGADIRSDPWGYAAPGYPEKAAEFAHRDAYVSHRRNGIYGAMYFSAAIAAAFAVDDPVAALRIGLEEIPADCYLAQEVRWSLDEAPNIKNYRDARAAVDARYPGMHKVHAINNAVLTIWGLTIGGEDYSKVIGETVAMGLDNDCTAATAGSIWGAVYGKDAIPGHWHENFNNKVHTFLIGQGLFALDDMVDRFVVQAERVLSA